MPGFVRSLNGISIRLPVVLSGWIMRSNSRGIRAKRLKSYDDLRGSVFSRTNGFAAGPCADGCRRVSTVARFTHSKRAAALASQSRASTSKIFGLTTRPLAHVARRVFPKDSDWLSLGPTGPRRLRLAVEHLAQSRGGICFMVDLDPRWVIKLIKQGKAKEAESYKQHVIEQGLTLLRAHPNIRCLFTTPKLLEALCERVSLKKMGSRECFAVARK